MELFNPFSLENKTILVTGASSGIGQGIAIYCSMMGARLIITGRDAIKLCSTQSKLIGDNHLALCGDLTKEEDILSLVNNLPPLDGIVHCMGVGHTKPTKLITSDDVDHVMDTNFKAIVLLQSALLQAKKVQTSGSIVFISSLAAQTPILGNAIYSASKGAIASYSKCLALELASRLIRVNCISPALVNTGLIMQDNVTIEELEVVMKKYPLKRIGTPEDIAYLTIYLLSDASSWMTGSNIEISGGGMGILTT